MIALYVCHYNTRIPSHACHIQQQLLGVRLELLPRARGNKVKRERSVHVKSVQLAVLIGEVGRVEWRRLLRIGQNCFFSIIVRNSLIM
jgi:hypothetical protein